MADIVNLRTLRKRKAKAEEEARAAENRAAFGRTKSEKSKINAELDLAKRQHEAHRRDKE